MSYDQKQSEQGGGVESAVRSRAPGKTTLTQRLPAIQRDPTGDGGDGGDGGDDAAESVHATAAAGVSGSGSPLPHLDLIQSSFGRHDIGHVQAHTGSAATQASAAIGARAYTTGSDIAFATPTPDLHLIAHEAAHVVQQQGGVQLKSGMGEVGDRYEQHADAVADLVVQGKSAESLLDTMSGSGGASSAIQRKEDPAHLDQKKIEANAKVADIGTQVEKDTREALSTALAKLLTAQHGATLTTKAKQEAEAAIAGATDIDKAAKAQAGTIASESVVAQIKEKTDAVSVANTGSVKLDVMTAARRAIADAKPGRVFDTKTAELVVKATTAAKAKAAEGAAARLTAGKDAIGKAAFVDTLTADSKTTSRTAMGEERTARSGADGAVGLLIGDPVDAAWAVVHTAVQSYLEEYIGANGSKWFGHDHANKFRQKMKDAGRKKAYAEIDGIAGGTKAFTHTDSHAHTEERLKNAGTATRDYFVMQGKAQAYDDAKVTVNDTMRQMAHDGANKLLKTADTEAKLTTAASTAAWGVLRDDPDGVDTKKAALKAAQSAINTSVTAQKTELLKAGGTAATWATTLTKSQGATQVETVDDSDVAGTLDAAGAKGKVEQEVGDKHVGSKSLETAIEGQTVADGVSKLGTLIDLAVPNSGEALKLAVEIKIPVPQAPGVFCVLKVEGAAERHQGKDLELGVTLEFGAGWETWGLSLDARIFLFLKARGADTDKALKMMSYGVYRDLSSNPVVPQDMALYWATGKAARTGEYSKMEEAETWAAMVEEYAMTGAGGENAYAEAGEGVVGNAKLKAGIVEGQLKASMQTMRHWDAKSMQRAGLAPGVLDHTGNLDQRKEKARIKREKASQGERRNQWNIETQIDFEAAGQKFGCGLKLQRVTGKKDATGAQVDDRLGWVDFELIGQLPFDASNPASSTLLSQIAGQYVPSGLSAIRSVYDRIANSQDKDKGAKGTGTGLDLTGDLLATLDSAGLTGNVQKALSDVKMSGARSEYMNDTVAGTLGTTPSEAPSAQVSRHAMKNMLQLSIYLKDGNLGFTLAEVKKLDLGIGERAGLGASATVSSEKTKKLFSAGMDGVNNW
ncbi:MAG TPA: DUF4157 domain-containing protein [Kofleriaceae bacterium]|nr:DUF4157 domain-containing protein [Kofleriaceae bacterium]